MKIMTLNVWGGKQIDELEPFLKEQSQNVDVFCFQEIYAGNTHIKNIWNEKQDSGFISNLFSKISEMLPTHNGFLAVAIDIKYGTEKIPYGLAIFAKKNLTILSQGNDEIFSLHEDVDSESAYIEYGIINRLLQHVTILHNDKPLTIFNLHGFHAGRGKEDSVERFKQSERIKQFMGKQEGSKILCGDFNLDIQTKSLEMLEDGMRNLIKETEVTSTRSHHYLKPIKFADYMLVTPDIEVAHFEVLQDVVSDHLPLMLEIT